MKKLLLSLLLLLGCLLPLRAEEELVSTLSVITVDKWKNIPHNQSYAYANPSDDGKWTLVNFNLNLEGKKGDYTRGKWTYAACGAKNTIDGSAYIYNNKPSKYKINKVVMHLATCNQTVLSKVNSITLSVLEDPEEEATAANTIKATLPKQTGSGTSATFSPSADITFEIPEELQSEKRIYKIAINYTNNTKTAGVLAFDTVKYYMNKSDKKEDWPWDAYFESKYDIYAGQSMDFNALIPTEENDPVLSYEIDGDTSTAGTLENGVFTAAENAIGQSVKINYSWESTEKWYTGSSSLTLNVIAHPKEICDVLNTTNFGFQKEDQPEYVDKTYTSIETGIVYTAHLSCNKIDDEDSEMVMTYKGSDSGIVVTDNINGYHLTRIAVSWSGATENGETIEIYGKKYSPYTEVSNLYSDEISESGYVIGIVNDPEDTDEANIDFQDAAKYIGIRSLSPGVEYINEIRLYWVKTEDEVGPSTLESPIVLVSSSITNTDETNVVDSGTLIAVQNPDNRTIDYKVYFNGDNTKFARMTDGYLNVRPGIFDDVTINPGELYTPTVVASREEDGTLVTKESVCPSFLTQPNIYLTPSFEENSSLIARQISLEVANPNAKVYYSTTKSMDNAEEYTGPVELAAGADILFWCELEADTDTRATTTYTSPAVFFQNNEAAPVSVEGIAADENAEVRYFDLQGRAVKADRLNPGIYIRIRGSKASKILVR